MLDAGGRSPEASRLERLLSVRGALVATGLVLLAFAAFEVPPIYFAALGFAAIVAAAILGRAAVPVPPRTGRAQESPGPALSPSIEILISKLPDPAIVLDRDGRVLAFNPRASAMTPALTRGGAASLAIRV